MDESSGVVVAGISVTVTVLVSLGAYVFTSLALGRVFVKLGQPAWKAWVPIVNTLTLYKLGHYSARWVVGLFIPVANLVAFVVFIFAVNNINRRLGHGGGFTVLCLIFLPVWAGVLGFGKSVDNGGMPQIAAPRDGPVGPVPAPAVSLSQSPSPSPSPFPPPSASAPAATGAVARPVEPPRPPDKRPTDLPRAGFPLPDLPSAPPAPSASVAPFMVPVVPAAPEVPAAQIRPPGPPPFYVRVPSAVPAVDGSPEFPAQNVAPTGSVSPDPVVTRPDAESTAPSGIPPAAEITAEASAEASAKAAAGVEIEGDEDDLDQTMIAVRRMKPWTLETEHGLKVSLTKPVVLLGRNPARGGAHADAQLVMLHDPGKTVSKTHARLEFFEGAWDIRDLQSTNGIVLIDSAGMENELDLGACAPLTDRFLLGELAARIYLEA